jgi:gliding motility-associated-like protein
MKPDNIKWFFLAGIIYLNLFSVFAQIPHIIDANGKKLTGEKRENWVVLKKLKSPFQEQLNDENTGCQTFVYRTKVQALPGDKIQLEGTTTFTDNSVVAAASVYGDGKPLTSFLLHLNADGGINKQVQFSIQGKPTRIMSITPDVGGDFWVAGVLSDQPATLFLSKLNIDFSITETTTWASDEVVTGVWMHAFPGQGVSIATETAGNHFIYQFSSRLKLLWTARFNRVDGNKLRGISFLPDQMVRIGRSKRNINGKQGYEVIELNYLDGAVLNSWNLPQELSGESLHNFKGFSNDLSLTGITQKPGGPWQVWHKNLDYVGQSFNDRFYELETPPDSATTLLPSQALDALAVCNATTGNLFFIYQNLLNDKWPTRTRIIPVPLQSRLKSFLRTADAGYQYGLDENKGNEIWFIKTDSAGLLSACETKITSVKYFRQAGTKYESFLPINSIIKVQENSSLAKTSVANFPIQIECQGNFCPPKPEQDTCTAGFLKIFRSNYYEHGIADGFVKNEKIYTTAAITDNFSSVVYMNTKLISEYSTSGAFQKSAAVFANGRSGPTHLWPGNGDTMLMHLPVYQNDSLFFIIAAINTKFEILWNTSILSYHKVDFINSPPAISNITTDDAGNIYITITQGNLTQIHQNFGAIKLNRQGVMQWNKLYRARDYYLGTATGTIGPAGLLLMATCGPSSFTMLLNKENGNLIASHAFDDNEGALPNTAITTYRLNFYNGKFYFLSSAFLSGKTILLASKFDEKGKPEKMVEVGPVTDNVRTTSWNGITDIMTSVFDQTTFRRKFHKIQLNEQLEITHSVLTDPGEGYYLPTRMMHTSSGSPILIGHRTPVNDPAASETFLAKFTQEGKLGNCTSEPLVLKPKEVFSSERVIRIEPSEFTFISSPALPLELIPFKYGITEAELLCKSDVKCTSLKITGNLQICNLSKVESFIAKTNNECSLMPQWQIDHEVMDVIQQKGDTLKVRFKVAGLHAIRAKILTGCSVLEDSLMVQVAPAINAINIGRDTVLCPTDSIQLNAGAGFTSYQWSTGATDSSIWVSKPGKYWVLGNTGCGAPMNDTIEIFMPAVPTLSAGSDSSVCTGTIFQRLATDGFATYQWKNLSTMAIISNSRLLESTPATITTTRFALQASTGLGCTGYDTLTLRAIAARSFSLGSNQNLCAGDTATFTAPLGYASYLWNTGSITNTIKAWQQGQYTLSVLDTNGCTAKDTVLINTVFALPAPNLGADVSVCSGSNLLLNPGAFARYQWQDGSTQNTFNAFANGAYFVQVWDANNCTSIDTMRIMAQLPLPASFLNATDSLCQYEKLTLQPNGVYKTYLWSTGSSQPSISVDKPGSYTLKVTNNNDCAGADTIRVIQESCMEGVYIPNAFSPDNDGLNDVFRPMVFGNVIHYEFSVFNRFGERIFTTQQPMQGWDGTWKGAVQPANTYAWMCSYQLEGGTAKVEKGMVSLVR